MMGKQVIHDKLLALGMVLDSAAANVVLSP